MDVSQYLEIFVEETKEHLQSLNEHILVIEKDPENKDTINEIFRAAHSLKGMAGTMGYKRMQNLTHDMENVFSEIRNDNLKVTSSLVDILFQCIDALELYLDSIINNQDEGTEDNEAIISMLQNYLEGDGENESPVVEKEAEVEEAKVEIESSEFVEVKFADFEKHAISEAEKKGLNVYGIHVDVDETCILRAARAFLVFKSLEEIGEIIKSVPSTQDIEDEKFDFDFQVYIISESSLEEVIAAVKNVSEIKDAQGKLIHVEYKEEKEIEKEVKVSESSKKSVSKTSEKTKQKSKAPANSGAKTVVNRSVRVDIEKLDILMNLVSELIIAKNGLVASNATDVLVNNQSFNEQIEYLERVTTNLHESVMNVRMVPIETVVNRFPRMIRDLTKKLDKKMELFMSGEETELDRTVIDEIGDPLMHLLRNSADHGLESADVRRERGKNEVGSIFLNAYQEGNNVVIEVGDDGNGIDVEKVKNKAIDKGVISEEQAETMTDKDIVELLFKPSFSTAEEITDVSGRGVGLDVVKSKIEALGGDVDIKTTYGEGSTFTIRLPLTLAIIQALMVQIGEEQYAISLGAIQTVEDVPVSDIKYVQGKEVIHLRGSVIPVIRLRESLQVPGDVPEKESLTIVIIKKGEKQAGLVVDELIGQMEIVIKSLGKYIRINKMISGATILGDGEVALIIDANAIV